MRILPWLIILITLIGCGDSRNSEILLHSNWEFSETNTGQWRAATIPGTVQTDLLNLGAIPDPFKGNNEDSIQWVSGKDWTYRTTFSVASEVLPKKHFLAFQGLDTYATVFLNDSLILTANNAFRSWEIDVTDLLQQENRLRVLFQPVDSIEQNEAEKLSYTLPESPRVFTRKAQFQYGWDWGPKIKTMGIWRDISLISYDKIRLSDVYIETNEINASEANLTAHITLDSDLHDFCDIVIENVTTGEIKKVNQELYGPSTIYKIPLSIKDPKLWWTHNLGAPFLYEFKITIKKKQQIISSEVQKIGLRTIELVTEKDSIGESFFFKLNGKPVYMKGANYIPQNIFLPEVTQKDREKLITDVVDANMNMLRVWGGGVYENDLFYDLCDEKGVLVWQDFMFACAMYPGDTAFIENVKQEAIENVKRLRKHPSIALWCGNNENSEGWARWGWADDKTTGERAKIWSDYHAVFRHVLPRVVDSLHSSVNYWESSPKYGRGDKRYKTEGDAHDWWVWHDGYPFEHFEKEIPRFMSEFGFQSFPSYEAIQFFTEQDSIAISHPSFTTHQKHSRGFQLIKEYMARDYPVPENDREYVYVSQLLQAYGITKGIRAQRKAKPYNMGSLYWQLNDCWPVVSWSSIDGLGNWKALHYRAKRAFENRLILAWEAGEYLNVTVADDALTSITGTLRVAIKDFEGNLVKEQTLYNYQTDRNKNEVALKMLLSDFEFNPANSFAEITFEKEKSIFYFEKPKDLKLPKQEIAIETTKTTEGFTLRLTSEVLQKDVFLYTDSKGHFDDNFFDLLPKESKVIIFKTDAREATIRYLTLNKIQ